ncbi:MAG: multiheme c-type cytochrome [Phycisphaerae bacterium]
MSLNTKRIVVFILGIALCVALIMVAEMESRKHLPPAERPLSTVLAMVPEASRDCIECHAQSSPGIVDHWKASTHARKGVACVECHQAKKGDVDGFEHYGVHIATVVTPRDCSGCHPREAQEFEASHHAAAGNILASLDNFLAEVVEGAREPFAPHSPTPGRPGVKQVNGRASATVGCKQCHGSKVALQGTDGGMISVDDLKPDGDGRPTNAEAVDRVLKDGQGKPKYHPGTWPNTGIGRLNLDGSRGSCSACHSRHDFSPRRARRPENCGKCHLGPDHPQKEIYEESKHGVAYRDLKDQMHLDGETWILGQDYSQAPTCATCHMSGHMRNGGQITHNPGTRISWTNRPPVSLAMDTDKDHHVIKETDPAKRRALVTDTWQDKRSRMSDVCMHCHTPDYITSFYQQYDDLVVLYNEKFAKPGQLIMGALRRQGLITKASFDEKIEWTWFYLWHHEGRRARHGASMMAPDYAHWHGMYEVAERFYQELIPEAREIAEHARQAGQTAQADAVEAVIDGILARPEHKWQGEASE